MEIAGLPLHPLVVHATVVLIPLTGLLVIVFAVLPRWRWLTRWPAAAASVLSVGLAYAATLTGEDLLQARPELTPLVAEHQDRGDLLASATIPFAVVVVLAAMSLGGPSALASGRGAHVSRVPVLDKVLPVVLVLGAVLVVVLTIRTGDSGARAVWEL